MHNSLALMSIKNYSTLVFDWPCMIVSIFHIYMTLALITGTSTENDVGSYFGMDGSALSPSRGQKHAISQ